MSQKKVKKFRKAIRTHLTKEIEGFQPLPFWQRVKVAWTIILKRPVKIK